MKTSIWGRYALISIALSVSSAQAESGFLNRSQIISAVAYSVWTGVNSVGNLWAVTYEPDGTMSGKAGNQSYEFVDTGKWWVDGYKLCSQYKQWFGGKPSCFFVKTEGNKIRLYNDSQKLVEEINLTKL